MVRNVAKSSVGVTLPKVVARNQDDQTKESAFSEFTVRHCEYVSSRSFELVVAAFEDAVGSVEDGVFDAQVQAAKAAPDFESRIRSLEGKSGFMRFLTVDHGAWLAHVGIAAKARMYTIGNPLIARTMIKYDLAVGLNVPVRLMIYEHNRSGAVMLAYDQPSSLLGVLRNADVTAAAKQLDEKLEALALLAVGAAT
jgi:uncharacterized protein (DUF302 family)